MPSEDVYAEHNRVLSFIGKLNIPKIGLEVGVQSTWDYIKLSYSPCRYAGKAYSDGFVIIAHRYHFGKIGNLRPGDTVNFTDMDGHIFRYKVVAVETLNGDQTSELLDKDYALTLMTCSLSGAQRTVVRCQRK